MEQLQGCKEEKDKKTELTINILRDYQKQKYRGGLLKFKRVS